jgi:phosphoglycerate dehydrogenase-like enzyme
MHKQVAVLRQKVHGMDASRYVEMIRDHLADATLDDYEVHLAETPAQERALLESAIAATGAALPDDTVSAAQNLSLFACIYAGTDHLDLDAYEDHGIAVTNASGVHGPNLSEHVVGGLITMAREFPRALDQQADGVWRSYRTRELHGSTVAVVGLGALGEAIVDRLEPFGVDTVGVRYSPEKGGPTDEVYGFDEIHEAVAGAEYVVLVCPLTDATEGLVDEAVLATMPANTIIVNVARGPVIDTDALLSALRKNKIGAAMLDVTDPEPLPPEHPLWDMDDVLITPHNAGHTEAYYGRCAESLVGNLQALEAGGDLRNRVV